MKVKKVSASDEMLILRACVTDKMCMARMASISDIATFSTSHAKLIFGWCLQHFEGYKEPPGREELKRAYLEWSERATDDKLVLRIEQFLDNIDDLPVNVDLIADRISLHFSKNSLSELSERIEDDVAAGRIKDASDAVAGWRPIEVGKDASVNVLEDMEAIQTAFDDDKEIIIEMPQGLGKFFGSDLCRDGFVAFMGPEKRGKTFAMMDLAYRAMLQKRRVAFFGLGDMSQSQYLHRFMIRAARAPQYKGEYKIPKTLSWKDDADSKEHLVTHSLKKYEKDLTWQSAWKECEKIVHKQGCKHPLLKLAAYPNSTMGVRNIEGVLDLWERDGWIPDVIVMDYADLLTRPVGCKDEREASNQNWKDLRRVSQERHLLLVTATQAAASSYDAWVITKQHFSEDKRKLAHVTGMVGLNQTPDEKDDGVMRYNWVVRRDADFSEYRCCLLAGNRAVGNIAMKSHFEG